MPHLDYDQRLDWVLTPSGPLRCSETLMRLLFLGDVVGRSGRQAVLEALPGLRARYELDFVAINGENAAGGFGITEAILEDLLGAGADVVTLGNHAFDQKEALVFIERHDRLLRPINYPPGTPGTRRGHLQGANGADVLVDQCHGPHLHARARRSVPRGRRRARPPAGSSRAPTPSSSTSTPRRRARSRRSAISSTGARQLVVGTHTHAPTADERVLPRGTAFMSDIGMCGDYNSVLGMDREEPINRFLTKIPRQRFEPAHGPGTLSGLAVEIDDEDRACARAKGLRLGGVLHLPSRCSGSSERVGSRSEEAAYPSRGES